MKRYLLLSLLLLVASSEIVFAQKSTSKDHVEVIYFHGKQRCATCRAIETCTKELIDSDFAKEQQQGRVIFRIVDISTDEGKKLAKKYQVSWSSLYVTRWKNGKESRTDLTQKGFQYARTNSAEFKKQLKKTIIEALK